MANTDLVRLIWDVAYGSAVGSVVGWLVHRALSLPLFMDALLGVIAAVLPVLVGRLYNAGLRSGNITKLQVTVGALFMLALYVTYGLAAGWTAHFLELPLTIAILIGSFATVLPVLITGFLNMRAGVDLRGSGGR